MAIIQLDPSDNIGVVLGVDEQHKVPPGHKVALVQISRHQPILKYGQVIGYASMDIQKGEHAHVHNIVNPESERLVPFAKTMTKSLKDLDFESLPTHLHGYKREKGLAGIRNFVLVVATVNCSATVVKAICRHFETLQLPQGIDGVIPVVHSQGCAQMIGGPGHQALNRTLAGWINHPNVVGSLIVGLGCEGTTMKTLAPLLGSERPHLSFDIQEVGGTTKAIGFGIKKVEELLKTLPHFVKTDVPISDLRIGLNCGGSDSYSSITANPALGVASDLFVLKGAGVALAEIPECFGAEDLLANRCADRATSVKLHQTFAWWTQFSQRSNISLNENLAPGNIAGGISTITEKSLGALTKAGSTLLRDVVDYASPLLKPGFSLMNTPGFDPVSVTGLVAGGCQLVAFTTGRGSVFGCSIAPTLKIATNSKLALAMADDIDVNAGSIVEGRAVVDVGREIFFELLKIAGGVPSKSESLKMGREEFTPWAMGDTL